MSRDEALCCVVAFSHHEWQRPAFMTYTGLLFGSSLAVTSFNRYSRFVEALSRRFAFCLTCLQFDDAHVTDRKSCKGSGQRAMQTLNTLLGTPLFQRRNARRCRALVHFWDSITISFKFMLRAPSKMTAHVRSKPTEAIRTAAVQRDMGFTAIFLLLANWGDVTLPAGLCSICSVHMPMEHSPSGIQRNGSQVAKTGLMLTDFIP